ncbi:MAG: hypothetical protein OHK0015_30020 [Chloroflexi bacterium OHK40]
MSFPDLFRRAALLWWRVRGLWPLGMLATVVGAGDYATSSFNVNTRFPAGEGGMPRELVAWFDSPFVRAVLANPLPFVLGAVVVTVLWALLTTLVGQLAHGAMIRMADVADQGYAARLGDAFSVGFARLLPMFLLALIISTPALFLIVAAAVGVALIVPQLRALDGPSPETVLPIVAALFLCLVPLVLLMLVLGLALSFFGRMAQRACVIEGLGPLASLGRAWRLVTRNFGQTLLVWLALLLTGSIFGAISTLPALAIAVPAFVSFYRSGAIPWVALIVLAIYSLVITVLLGGWLTSFSSTLWTLHYRSCVSREAQGAATPQRAASAP